MSANEATCGEWYKNHHYRVRFVDYTPTRDYIESLKPEEKKGQKYANWKKWDERFKLYYSKLFWVQIEFWGDDDMIESVGFESFDEAQNCYLDLCTCAQVPDFKKLGLF